MQASAIASSQVPQRAAMLRRHRLYALHCSCAGLLRRHLQAGVSKQQTLAPSAAWRQVHTADGRCSVEPKAHACLQQVSVGSARLTRQVSHLHKAGVKRVERTADIMESICCIGAVCVCTVRHGLQQRKDDVIAVLQDD
jgi:hypothetical protein